MALETRMILRQPVSTVEARAVMHAGLLIGMEVRRCEIADLQRYSAQLASGEACPVGSVAYVLEAMRVSGIRPPDVVSYPAELSALLGRKVWSGRRGALPESTCFVKPALLKQFNGFVLPADKRAISSEHDLEQWSILKALPGDTPLLFSDVVTWQSEWRYYVMDREVIGIGRYDSYGDDEAREPDRRVVDEAVRALDLDYPFALDVGVLDTDVTALVEFTDAWAIGLYRGTMTDRAYLNLLIRRWQSMAAVKCAESDAAICTETAAP